MINKSNKGKLMNELIKLNETEINNETVQTVSARDLHAFLGVGKVFAAWIKNRLYTLGDVTGNGIFKKETSYI